MPKYRMTYCQDDNLLNKGAFFFAPIDLRKKHYFCHHCQKHHLVKDGLKKPTNLKLNIFTK